MTPDELQARRRNRFWMVGIAVPAIILLVLALLASGIAESNTPSGPAVATIPGYKAVRDGYYSYLVPASWSTNGAFTDAAGDVETSGSSGWAAEHIAYKKSAPTLGEASPKVLGVFGVGSPEPYELTGGHDVEVKGATAAIEYVMSRPGGFRATVVDAWSDRSGVEIWLTVHAGPGVASRIVSSLRA